MCVTSADPRLHAPASARARDIVRGAYDLHVHVNPDVITRRIDDLDLAERFGELGLRGFVLKSHYVPTAERARVVRKAVPGVDALGAIVLNQAVGGLNTIAVEIAAREGARFVWLPTFDAENEPAGRVAPQPGAHLPAWAEMQHELRRQGVASEPVPVVDTEGNVLPETRAVLRAVARHGLVLATGHLGRDEIFAVVDAAREEGVEHIVVTHPEFPTQRISPRDQAALAERGALLERCFTTAHTGKVAWEEMYANIRAAGIERSFLSTDLGQLSNPPIEDGLALMADRMVAAGFSSDEIHRMAVVNTRLLAKGER